MKEESAIPTEFSDGVGLQMTLPLFTLRPLRAEASKIATAHCRTHCHGGSRPLPDREVIQQSEPWFIKVVATLFLRSRYLDTSLDYLRERLTPLVAFEVIRRFNNPEIGLKFLEFSRLNLNINHSFLTYHLLMRSLCQMGLHDSAKAVFDYMRIDGHFPDNNLLGFLVTSFAQDCKFNLVNKLLVEVQGEEVEISLHVYNYLLNELVKHDKVSEAICLFKEHFSLQYPPNTWTFNILIRGLCRVGDVDRAFELFNDMGTFGCLPDVVTYNTLINGFCRVNEVDKGRDLLKEVQSRSDCSPNVVTYTSIISGFCKLGKMDDASALYEEMIRFRIKANIITFNVLIDGFGKIGNMVAAEGLHERMACCGLQPDVVTFTSLIDGYCRTGQVNVGLRLWDFMKAKNVFPNVYTYAILINALCKENRIHKARELLRQLKYSNIFPKPFMYNPVIDGFCKAGNVDEANVIVAEMEEKRCYPDKVTYTILIIGHCMKGRMSEAIDIFNKMLAVGCAPDNITLSSFISCLLKAGMPNEVSHVLKAVSNDLNMSLSSSRKITPLRTNIDIPVAV